ncbi:MAG: ketopantoate reductase family protein [Bacteroidetes bacterium]|nr:ketopantoate reductase family protein [Bacteroidota bacterium]
MQGKNTTIFIVGAGAIGKALAAFLKQKGKDIVLLRGHINDRSTYIEKIEVVLNNNEIVREDILVSTVKNYSALNGIIVLANKSYGNIELSERLKNKINESPLVILQNGLNVEQPFLEKRFPQIYRCVMFATCQVTGESRLKFKPVSISPIGVIKGSDKNLARIVGHLSNSHFLFKQEEHIQPILWTKVIVNSIFNSICPLLATDNGIFCRNEKALDIAMRVINECIAIAASQGISLNPDKVLSSLLLISRSSDGQLISTYQDLLNKRKTEIGTLNVAIARIADKLEGKGLAKETNLLGELIQIKSEIAMTI